MLSCGIEAPSKHSLGAYSVEGIGVGAGDAGGCQAALP